MDKLWRSIALVGLIVVTISFVLDFATWMIGPTWEHLAMVFVDVVLLGFYVSFRRSLNARK